MAVSGEQFADKDADTATLPALPEVPPGSGPPYRTTRPTASPSRFLLRLRRCGGCAGGRPGCGLSPGALCVRQRFQTDGVGGNAPTAEIPEFFDRQVRAFGPELCSLLRTLHYSPTCHHSLPRRGGKPRRSAGPTCARSNGLEQRSLWATSRHPNRIADRSRSTVAESRGFDIRPAATVTERPTGIKTETF